MCGIMSGSPIEKPIKQQTTNKKEQAEASRNLRPKPVPEHIKKRRLQAGTQWKTSADNNLPQGRPARQNHTDVAERSAQRKQPTTANSQKSCWHRSRIECSVCRPLQCGRGQNEHAREPAKRKAERQRWKRAEAAQIHDKRQNYPV